MDYRVLTVNREFGSGGGRIAQTIAEWLGWKLLDRDIIDAIAYAAHVDCNVVRHYDEHVDSWLRRINQQAMRSAALAAGLELGENNVFDAEEMVKISRKIVEEAYAEGNCVIVGRGSQCILQHKPDVFHVFVYAPYLDRLARLKDRLEKGIHPEQRIRAVDEERVKYLQQYYGKAWNNPHLYDLMISSRADEEFTARAILYAMNGEIPA
ncbi:MAG: cytidylate kinase-like family protein [Terracidiphilus sp.]